MKRNQHKIVDNMVLPHEESFWAVCGVIYKDLDNPMSVTKWRKRRCLMCTRLCRMREAAHFCATCTKHRPRVGKLAL